MYATGRTEPNRTHRTHSLLSGGKHAACKLKRAQILLAADAGASDEEIARSVGVGGSTVYRTKQRFVLGNLQAALSEEPRPEQAASSPAKRKPAGRDRLFQATAGPRPLDARAVGGPTGQANRAQRSRARPCAGGWPKTTSSPGARTCGAFRPHQMDVHNRESSRQKGPRLPLGRRPPTSANEL